MKIFKKSLAAVMAAVMIMSSGAVAASAAEVKTAVDGSLGLKEIVTDGLSFLFDGEKSSTVSETSSDDTEDSSSLPDSYDLRDYGRLTEPSSQKYGDCWAYATIASLESNSLSKGYGENLFSRSHLTSFAMNPATEGPKTSDVWNNGGNSYYAAYTLSNLEGIASRSSFPDKTDDSFTISESDRYCHDSGYIIDDAVYLSSMNDIKKYIMKNGAVSADYYSLPSVDCVYSSTYNADMIYTPKTAVTSTTNHEIAIVGWNDTIPASEFSHNNMTPSVDGGWLIRNSWLDSKDSSYYMYISYDQNIENVCGFSVQEDTYIYRNYTYAPRGGESEIGSGSYLSFGNVFTSQGEERLSEVGFFFAKSGTSDDTTVTVSVYKNLPDGDSINGAVPAYCFGKTVSGYGFFTLEFPQAVSVSQGERYAVTITLTNSNADLYTVVEQNSRSLFRGYSGTYSGGSDRSYAKTEKDGNYIDIYDSYSGQGVCDVFMQVYTSCNHEAKLNGDGTKVCSQCGKSLPTCSAHADIYKKVIKEATYSEEGETEIYCARCGERIGTGTINRLAAPSLKIVNNPGTKNIKYGSVLRLYAEAENQGSNCYIRWRDSSGSDSIISSMIYFTTDEDCTITAELVDKDGNPVLDADGNPISDSEKITVKKNIILYIIAFFKNLFGIGQTVVEN